MSIVRTDLELFLWQQAQTKLEWGTTKFWEHKIRPWYPAEDGWVIASQQPPTDENTNLRRVELVVDKWTGTGNLMHRLFVFEAKKQNASQTEIDNLEHQAFNACMAHLIYTGRTQMYAMTAIGTTARLWVAHTKEPYLVPWMPEGTTLSDKTEYIEAHSSRGHLIEDGWKYMKKHAEMPEKKLKLLLQNLSYDSAEGIQPSASAGHSDSPLGSPPYALGNPSNDSGGSLQNTVSYPSANTGSGGRSFPYTVTYASPSTGSGGGSRLSTVSYPSASTGTGSGTTIYPIRSVTEQGFDTQAEAVAHPHQHVVPDGSIYVIPKIEERNDEEDLYHFDYSGLHYAKQLDLWKDGQVKVEGKWYECCYYRGLNTGMYFWTYSLRDLEFFETETAKGKGKAKDKKGKGRKVRS